MPTHALPSFLPQEYHLQVYQLSPPGSLPHPSVFWVRAYCQNQQVNHFVLTSTPDLSQFGITKDKVFTIPRKQPRFQSAGSPTGCVDASPLALRRYIPPPRPTATLISCHAWGFQPRNGIWHVHTRLLRTQRYPNRPSLPYHLLIESHSYAPSLACARRVTAYARRCLRLGADKVGGSFGEFLEGFPCLPGVLFADVIRGQPTLLTIPMHRWGAPRMRTSTPRRLRSVPVATSGGTRRSGCQK